MLLFLMAITEDSAKSKIRYIYDHYHNDMIRFARYRLQKAERKTTYYDAEDIVQEAFIKLTRSQERIDLSWEPKRMKAYLFAIISNLIIDLTQKENPHDNLEDYTYTFDNDEDFVEYLMVKERVAEIAKALDELSEVNKITLMYRFFEERSISEIASFMGVSEHTVYMRISRGQQYLKKALKGGESHDK